MIGMELGPTAEGHAIHAIAEVLTGTTAVTECAHPLIDIAASDGSERSVRVFRIFRDDVDHAIHCVRSPDRATGAANYFDSIDILKHHVLYFPIDAGKERRINAPAVN